MEERRKLSIKHCWIQKKDEECCHSFCSTKTRKNENGAVREKFKFNVEKENSLLLFEVAESFQAVKSRKTISKIH